MAESFITDFAAAHASIPVEIENQKFTQPTNSSWVSFHLRWFHSARASIGTSNRFKRHEGMVIVEVFVKEDTGTATMYSICKTIEDTFDEAHFALSDGSYVTCHVPKVKIHGLQDGFFVAQVMTEFCLDTVS